MNFVERRPTRELRTITVIGRPLRGASSSRTRRELEDLPVGLVA